jgi:hypothetical protein
MSSAPYNAGQSFVLVKSFLLCLFVTLCSSEPVPNCDAGQTSRYEPLACWLWKLAIRIPNQSFREGIFEMRLDDMICTNFQLSGISSQYVPSTNTSTDPTIPITVTAIAASCSGTYQSTGFSGTVTTSVTSPQQALGMALCFGSNSTTKPDSATTATSVSTRNCTTDLVVDKMHFDDSMSAHVINLFKGSIAAYVSSQLSTQLCPVLTAFLDDTLTRWIGIANEYLLGLIDDDPVVATERRLTEDVLQFRRDTPLLVTLVELANKLIDRYLTKGLFWDFMEGLGIDLSDAADCGYFFKGINGLVQSLTNGQIHFKLPANSKMTFVIPNYALLLLHVQRIELSGMGALDGIQLLEPNGEISLASWIKSQSGFNVTAALNVTVSPMEGGMFQGDPLNESFHIFMHTSNVTAAATLATDLTLTLLDQIQLGHIISAIDGDRPVLGCLVNPLQSIQAESLSAQLHFQSVSFVPDGPSGRSLEDDMDAMINNFLQLFVGEYSQFVTAALNGFVRGPGRKALNRLGVESIRTLRSQFPPSTCAPVVTSNATDFVDFTKYGVFNKMNEFLNRPTVLTSANAYVNCLAETIVTQVGSFTTFGAVTVKELILDNVGSFESIKFLSPEQDGVRLQNSVGCGRSTLASSFDVMVTNLTGTSSVRVTKDKTLASAMALILYDLNKARSMSLADLLKIGYCFTVPATEFVFYNVASTMSNIQVAINATMTGFLASDTIEFNFDSNKYPLVPALVESIFSWGVSTTFDTINGLSRYLVSKSDLMCDGATVDSTNDETKLSEYELKDLLWLFMFFVFANISFLFFRDVISTSRAHDGHAEGHHDEGHHDDDTVYRPLLQSRGEDLLTNDDGEPKSILETKEVSPMVRHLFPILIIGTVALLIASNLSVGASVNMTISLPNGKYFSLPSLFAFSLGHTIEEMYNARIWALFLLVVVFSGIWPYLKLLLLLYAWVAPPTLVSQKRRGELLFSLDALGKFSLVDTFVLVVMIVSFRYHVEAGGTALDVYVNPTFGFYGFLLTTFFSLVAGHFALFFHRQASIAHQSASTERESLFQHGFVHGIARKRLSWLSRGLILILLVTVVVLLAIGAVQKSFVFDIGGLAGALIGEQKRRSYSMISLGSAIARSVEDPSFIGIRFLQGIYFFYSIVTPFSCLLALFLLLLVPLSLTRQRKLMVIAEVANAWSAIEVFALSMIAALFEISTFANFIVGDKCDVVNLLLRENVNGLGDDKCFSVDASVRVNVLFLVFGVLLNSFVVSILLRLAHVALNERHSSEDRLGEIESLLEPSADVNESLPLVRRLMQSTLRGILFTDVTDEHD